MENLLRPYFLPCQQREQRQGPLRGQGREGELGALAWGRGQKAGSGRLNGTWRATLIREPCYWTEEPSGLVWGWGGGGESKNPGSAVYDLEQLNLSVPFLIYGG